MQTKKSGAKGCLAALLAGWPAFTCLAGLWLVGDLAGLKTAWLACWLADKPVAWLAGWLAGRSSGISIFDLKIIEKEKQTKCFL